MQMEFLFGLQMKILLKICLANPSPSPQINFAFWLQFASRFHLLFLIFILFIIIIISFLGILFNQIQRGGILQRAEVNVR